LTTDLQQLERATLAGATIRQARWNPGARVFELLLHEQTTGDLLLRYRGVQLLEPDLPTLAALCEDVSLSVSASSVGRHGNLPEHRVALGDRGVLMVRFGALELHEGAGGGPHYGDVGPRFQVLSC
jgi:hypothetical protein